MAGSERKKTTVKGRSKSVDPATAHAGSTNGRSSDVSREQIARRAWEIYLSRGATDGRDFDDWLQAERELARR